MEVHTRYLGCRDGVFRVIVEGPRPRFDHVERLASTVSATTSLIEHLKDEYSLYASGVDKLCQPDGIAELMSPQIIVREQIDDIVISRTSNSVYPPITFIGNRVS